MIRSGENIADVNTSVPCSPEQGYSPNNWSLCWGSISGVAGGCAGAEVWPGIEGVQASKASTNINIGGITITSTMDFRFTSIPHPVLIWFYLAFPNICLKLSSKYGKND